MTVTADGFDRSDSGGIFRWTSCLLVVLALHAGLMLALILRQVQIEPAGAPPATVIIDLPPLSAPAPPTPVAPPPPEPQTQPSPLEPQTQSLPLPEPEVPKLVPSPVPHPAVALPAPQPPKPKPKVKRATQAARPPPRQEPAMPMPPPAATASLPPSSAPPSASQAPARSAPAAQASWQAQLVAWIEKYKRYPRVAQEQRLQGVVYLRFAIDRQGKVLSSQINKSSGYELLDDEVLELIRRAQPLPSPPAEVTGDRIELLVPITFALRRNR